MDGLPEEEIKIVEEATPFDRGHPHRAVERIRERGVTVLQVRETGGWLVVTVIVKYF